MTTTPLPTDPAARLSLYISNLTSVAHPTAKQSAELQTYASRLAGMQSAGTARAVATGGSYNGVSGARIAAGSAQAAATQAAIVAQTSAYETAMIDQAVQRGIVAPGQPAPANWAQISAAIYDASSKAAIANVLSHTPGATIAAVGTPTLSSALSSAGLAPTGAVLTSSGGGTPTGAVLTSSGGGTPTPTLAGVSASPYVASLDNSTSGGGAAGSGGAGMAMGTGYSTGGSGSSLTAYALIGGAALAAYLVLGRRKGGRP